MSALRQELSAKERERASAEAESQRKTKVIAELRKLVDKVDSAEQMKAELQKLVKNYEAKSNASIAKEQRIRELELDLQKSEADRQELLGQLQGAQQRESIRIGVTACGGSSFTGSSVERQESGPVEYEGDQVGGEQ